MLTKQHRSTVPVLANKMLGQWSVVSWSNSCSTFVTKAPVCQKYANIGSSLTVPLLAKPEYLFQHVEPTLAHQSRHLIYFTGIAVGSTVLSVYKPKCLKYSITRGQILYLKKNKTQRMCFSTILFYGNIICLTVPSNQTSWEDLFPLLECWSVLDKLFASHIGLYTYLFPSWSTPTVPLCAIFFQGRGFPPSLDTRSNISHRLPQQYPPECPSPNSHHYREHVNIHDQLMNNGVF